MSSATHSESWRDKFKASGEQLVASLKAEERKWHLTRDGKSTGPYTGNELVLMYAANQISSADLAWSKEMPNWQPIGEIPELQSLLDATVQEPGRKPNFLAVYSVILYVGIVLSIPVTIGLGIAGGFRSIGTGWAVIFSVLAAIFLLKRFVRLFQGDYEWPEKYKGRILVNSLRLFVAWEATLLCVTGFGALLSAVIWLYLYGLARKSWKVQPVYRYHNYYLLNPPIAHHENEKRKVLVTSGVRGPMLSLLKEPNPHRDITTMLILMVTIALIYWYGFQLVWKVEPSWTVTLIFLVLGLGALVHWLKGHRRYWYKDAVQSQFTADPPHTDAMAATTIAMTHQCEM